MKKNKRYYNVSQYAELTGWHRKTIHQWLKNGDLSKSEVEKPDGTKGFYIDVFIYPPEKFLKKK